ncbi:unnamed protein product [Rangifer tarandus platyrhynchus]|uniref:EF-hand domain-containing protein n=1 Tax=Rangifer tarandus platyrhynchus TaxID=3082113 RepID=A0ABN8ZLW6_RANTA|nr:unnamed protein product [Rangifer tarandus platyrhynchus]
MTDQEEEGCREWKGAGREGNDVEAVSKKVEKLETVNVESKRGGTAGPPPNSPQKVLLWSSISHHLDLKEQVAAQRRSPGPAVSNSLCMLGPPVGVLTWVSAFLDSVRPAAEVKGGEARKRRVEGARAPRRARKKAEGGASSNVFSMFDQSQIQEFKEAFTIMDQNRDGFIDKEDLRDTFAALGRINVKNEELEAMVKEAPGPINFTVFLTMFGEKLKGTDPEETILHAFKVFDTEGKGFVKADFIKEKLMTQADRFSEEEVKQMFAAFPPDVCGNLDYRNLCYVITHGEEKD